MNNRKSPLHWSFSCGTWAGTDVRISYFMPLLLVLICWRLEDLQLGLVFGLIFVVTILLHEAAHIFAVRSTGGTGDEILLWPLGGLAMCYPARSFRSQFLTPAAGPLMDLALCGMVAYPAFQLAGTAILNPFYFPSVSLSQDVVGSLCVLTFWINWVLTLINLVPVYPLDGGRMLQSILNTRFNGEESKKYYLYAGLAVGAIGFLIGLGVDSAFVVALAATILILNLSETHQMQSTETYDESFLGYDFSQGYTSLERSEEERPAKKPGVLQRWKERRKAEKERRVNEQNQQIQAELDVLLQKIQDNGMDSLTDAERRQLKKAAALLREKGKSAN